MSQRIEQLVSLYFQGIPFSVQTLEAQQAIQHELEQQLNQLTP